MKRLWLIGLVVMGLLYMVQNAGAAGVTTLPLDREVALEAPDTPMNKATAPRLLYERYNRSWEPYVRVYRFKVVPGQRYTFYMIHPADGAGMNAYLRGDNPLTDYTSSYGPDGYLRGFVSWGQQPRKESSCEERARRFNFTISPKSEHQWLYLVATYAKPDTSFRVLLKSRADSDEEVKSSTQDAYCPSRKGFTWGQVWTQDFLLTLIPGEKRAKEAPVPVARGNDGSPQPDGFRTVNEWVAYISSGRPFQVAFDAIGGKFDDSTYSGDVMTDPLGTLKGGETYRLQYKNGKFECTGFNQGTGSVGTWAYIGDPAGGVISMWGRLFNFDGTGRVWDQDFGVVGHMRPVR